MPFIGTRFQHRQHGMCRVFMNELEKVFTIENSTSSFSSRSFLTFILKTSLTVFFKMWVLQVLIDLGVERLVLPAVPCVLDTWTNSFGFSKVTIPEKKDFLQFTFLEFGRTILCQKILIKSSVSHPLPSTSTG